MKPSESPPEYPFAGWWPMPKAIVFWTHQNTIELIPLSEKAEVTAALNAELSPIKVDHEMRTSLSGLFAVGDTCYQGSGWAGAVPAPPGRLRGSGIMNATFTSLRGGAAVGRFVSKTALREVNPDEVEELREKMFAPMQRDTGLSPADAIYDVQSLVGKVKYNLHRNKSRLEEAISKIEGLRQRESELCAKNYHALGKCHEARSMAVCAEMTFRSALMRTESRGSHYREDYPEQDNKNWIKWVVIKREGDEMVLFTEPIPIERYKFKP